MAEAVDRLASEYLDRLFEAFPTEGTLFGVQEHDGRLEDPTEAGLDACARSVAGVAAARFRDFHDRVLSYGQMPPTPVARALAATDRQSTAGQPDPAGTDAGQDGWPA